MEVPSSCVQLYCTIRAFSSSLRTSRTCWDRDVEEVCLLAMHFSSWGAAGLVRLASKSSVTRIFWLKTLAKLCHKWNSRSNHSFTSWDTHIFNIHSFQLRVFLSPSPKYTFKFQTAKGMLWWSHQDTQATNLSWQEVARQFWGFSWPLEGRAEGPWQPLEPALAEHSASPWSPHCPGLPHSCWTPSPYKRTGSPVTHTAISINWIPTNPSN